MPQAAPRTPLQLLAGGGIAAPIRALAEAFEAATGTPVVIRFGTTPELQKLATTGGPFDCGVTPREVFGDAAARAAFAPAPTVDVARVGLGIAVPAGAPRPDVSTPEAFRRAMLEARAVAGIPESAGGRQIRQVFESLGIADAMQPKILATAGPVQLVKALAAGEAPIGVFLMNVLTAPGIELVGPFPGTLQREVTFTSALAASPAQPDVARAFLDSLRTPAAQAVITRLGMTPA